MKIHLTIALFLSLIACADRKQPVGEGESKHKLPYDLSAPEKFFMPNILHEISGIAFSNSDDTIYAEQDEEGILFRYIPSTKQILQSKFGKKGDYEDVAICHNTVIMLRSDGTLYTFPLSEVNDKHTTGTREWGGLLPSGEYEGLYSDAASNKLYVLCKHCSDENTSKEGGGTILNIDAASNISAAGSFDINVRRIEKIAGEKKISFHPSALSKNKLTNEWYMLSSVNKMLVVADSTWHVKDVYNLNPSTFVQPEGMAFDSKNNLYISNEGSTTSAGNILKFTYKP